MTRRFTFDLQEFNPRCCKVGQDSPCHACFKIIKFDAEIWSARERLRNLIKERDGFLRAEVNQAHDPVMTRLPTEVVLQIFTSYVKDREPLCVNGEVRAFKKDDCAAPLILSAICKHWRELMVSTPTLWTTINVCLRSKKQDSLQKELLEQWLSRSAELPLHFCAFPSLYRETLPLSEFLFKSIPVVETIIQVMGRLQKLELYIPINSYSGTLSNVRSAPMLEELRLWVPLDIPSYPLESSLPELPVLRDFRTSHYMKKLHSFPPHFDSLLVCHMCDLGVDEVLEVLRRCPNLEDAAFTRIEPDQSHFPLPDQPIIHQHLKSLEILPSFPSSVRPEDLVTMTVLFRTLVLPSLQRFSYDYFSFKGKAIFPTDLFISFLNRSQCELQEFELKGSAYHRMSDDDLIPILEALPFIKRLSLKCTCGEDQKWMTDQFFRRFSNEARDLSKQSFLPNLERLNLEIRACKELPFSWDTVGGFVESMYKSLSEDSDALMQRRHLVINIKVFFVGERVNIEPGIATRLIKDEYRRLITLNVIDGGRGSNKLDRHLTSLCLF